MTSPWAVNAIRSLQVPNPEVPPGSPRLVITPDIPSGLANIDPGIIDVSAAILWYYNSTDFYFQAIGEFLGDPLFFEGTWDSVNGGVIIRRTSIGVPTLTGFVETRTTFGGTGTTDPVLYSLNDSVMMAIPFAPGPDTGAFYVYDNYVANHYHIIPVQHEIISFNPAVGISDGGAAAFVNIAGMSLLFDKDYDSTDIEVTMHVSGFPNVANHGSEWGVLLNGVDTPITRILYTAVSHEMASGVVRITGVPAAANYVVQGRYRTFNGVGTTSINVNNYCSMSVREITNP